MSRARGARAESLAAAELERLGYAIVGRNVYAGRSEIDIVAEDDGVLCFVEVRARKSSRFGTPAASVSPEKQRHLVRAATAYLGRFEGAPPRCRFDVVSVVGAEGEEQLSVVKNAFIVEGGAG